MNKTTSYIAILILILLAIGCKKEQFEHGPIDFSYADDIAGTYTGISVKDGPIYWTAPEGTYQTIDTVTVIVEDHRTDKVCGFYIDFFDKEFNVKPNGDFENSYEETGGTSTIGHTYHGYFKGDTLFYTHQVNYYKIDVTFYAFKMKLVKQ